MVANSEAKFRITALIGKIKEPVNRNRSTMVEKTIHSAAHGKLVVMALSASVYMAEDPPTSN
jgi:hypothetical protein